LRAFAHMVIGGDHNVRNHLSVTGPSDDVAAYVRHARVTTGGVDEIVVGGEHLPIGYEERRRRAQAGAWITLEAGREPQSGSTQSEEAEAVFSFPSAHSLEGDIAPTSEEHPTLEFRYACFEHRGTDEDVARGGLWKAGRRLAEHIGSIGEAPPDSEQLAALVRDVEALESAPVAVAPAS
ncbi:MAG: hypothetical protein ACR2JV_02530, partial [Gaiellales bacterium]